MDDLILGSERDTLFADGPFPKPFAFTTEVARVFDDMALRSIPLYREVTTAAVKWTLRHLVPGRTVIDVGCSTGTTLAELARALRDRRVKPNLRGIDTSEPMLALAKEKLAPWTDYHHMEFLFEDVREATFANAGVVIVNYTLQFLPVACRLPLIARIHAALPPGGILIVSDKIRDDNPRFEETVTAIYESFKRERGYSATEIERKKEALDQVLIPLTLRDQMQMFERAGFTETKPIIAWHNFLTTVSIKSD